MNEHIENMRRMAERGLKRAETPPMESSYIDIFQHILNEYELAKKDKDEL